MEALEALGYKLTFSGPSPIVSWGKYVIHAKAVDKDGKLQGLVAGYGDDEVAAIADAIKTLGGHKS